MIPNNSCVTYNENEISTQLAVGKHCNSKDYHEDVATKTTSANELIKSFYSMEQLKEIPHIQDVVIDIEDFTLHENESYSNINDTPTRMKYWNFIKSQFHVFYLTKFKKKILKKSKKVPKEPEPVTPTIERITPLYLIEREWFTRKYEREISMPPPAKDIDFRNVERCLKCKAFFKICDRERRLYKEYKQEPKPKDVPDVAWRGPLIQCCPIEDCECRGDILLPSKRIPFAMRYNWRPTFYLRMLFCFKKYQPPTPSKQFAEKLAESVQAQEHVYKKLEEMGKLKERGPEFCLNRCLNYEQPRATDAFYRHKKQLQQSYKPPAAPSPAPPAVIFGVGEGQGQGQEQGQGEDSSEFFAEDNQPVKLAETISDGIYRTFATQYEIDENGQFIYGKASHVLFGKGGRNILQDIEGTELNVCSYQRLELSSRCTGSVQALTDSNACLFNIKGTNIRTHHTSGCMQQSSNARPLAPHYKLNQTCHQYRIKERFSKLSNLFSSIINIEDTSVPMNSRGTQDPPLNEYYDSIIEIQSIKGLVFNEERDEKICPCCKHYKDSIHVKTQNFAEPNLNNSKTSLTNKQADSSQKQINQKNKNFEENNNDMKLTNQDGFKEVAQEDNSKSGESSSEHVNHSKPHIETHAKTLTTTSPSHDKAKPDRQCFPEYEYNKTDTRNYITQQLEPTQNDFYKSANKHENKKINENICIKEIASEDVIKSQENKIKSDKTCFNEINTSKHAVSDEVKRPYDKLKGHINFKEKNKRLVNINCKSDTGRTGETSQYLNNINDKQLNSKSIMKADNINIPKIAENKLNTIDNQTKINGQKTKHEKQLDLCVISVNSNDVTSRESVLKTVSDNNTILKINTNDMIGNEQKIPAENEFKNVTFESTKLCCLDNINSSIKNFKNEKEALSKYKNDFFNSEKEIYNDDNHIVTKLCQAKDKQVHQTEDDKVDQVENKEEYKAKDKKVDQVECKKADQAEGKKADEVKGIKTGRTQVNQEDQAKDKKRDLAEQDVCPIYNFDVISQNKRIIKEKASEVNTNSTNKYGHSTNDIKMLFSESKIPLEPLNYVNKNQKTLSFGNIKIHIKRSYQKTSSAFSSFLNSKYSKAEPSHNNLNKDCIQEGSSTKGDADISEKEMFTMQYISDLSTNADSSGK